MTKRYFLILINKYKKILAYKFFHFHFQYSNSVKIGGNIVKLKKEKSVKLYFSKIYMYVFIVIFKHMRNDDSLLHYL